MIDVLLSKGKYLLLLRTCSVYLLVGRTGYPPNCLQLGYFSIFTFYSEFNLPLAYSISYTPLKLNTLSRPWLSAWRQ